MRLTKSTELEKHISFQSNVSTSHGVGQVRENLVLFHKNTCTLLASFLTDIAYPLCDSTKTYNILKKKNENFHALCSYGCKHLSLKFVISLTS